MVCGAGGMDSRDTGTQKETGDAQGVGEKDQGWGVSGALTVYERNWMRQPETRDGLIWLQRQKLSSIKLKRSKILFRGFKFIIPQREPPREHTGWPWVAVPNPRMVRHLLKPGKRREHEGIISIFLKQYLTPLAKAQSPADVPHASFLSAS